MQESVSSNAIIDVNSSIKVDAALSVICKEVITKRQNPKRLAAVLNMCWEVLVAIFKCENIGIMAILCRVDVK